MKHMNAVKKYIAPTAIAGSLAVLPGLAMATAADLVTAATGHVETVTDSAWSFGAVIIGAVAVGVCIALVVGLMRKA